MSGKLYAIERKARDQGMGIEFSEKAHRMSGKFFIMFQALLELAACMRHAAYKGYFSTLKMVIGGISVRLQIAFEAFEKDIGALHSPAFLIIKTAYFFKRGKISPVITLMGAAGLITAQYRYRCFIGLQITALL